MSLSLPGLSVFGYCSLPPQPERWDEKPPRQHDTEATGPLRAKSEERSGVEAVMRPGGVGASQVPREPRGLLRKATGGTRAGTRR